MKPDAAARSRMMIAGIALLTLAGCARERDGMRERPSPDARSYLVSQESLINLHPGVTFTMLHPECGHSLKKVDNTDVDLNWIGLATSFPEYHDCQRLIEPSNTSEYAQLAALFATQQERPTAAESSRAYLLAYAINFGQASGNNTYAPLNLTRGISCVYAQLHPSATYAWLIPTSGSIDCTDLVIDTAGLPAARRLELQRIRHPGATAADYPRVARWDWDANRSEQYIGVECGVAWCEIGRAGFTSSPVPAVPPGAPMPNSRVYRIKGWFDVQRLAVQSAGRLVPGAQTGVIYPHPFLDSREWSDFGLGVQGAIFAIDNASAIYDGKFNMGPGASSVVHVTRPTSGSWNGRARRGPADRKVRVTYRPQLTAPARLRGTARWRWTDEDESAWMSCVHGCCQVDPW